MYGPVSVRLLRKADGTACFFLPPAMPGTGFSPLPSRVTLEFRRDNSAFNPDSIVLSAAGQTNHETAILDIPWTTV
jgi:hypothetical protein